MVFKEKPRSNGQPSRPVYGTIQTIVVVCANRAPRTGNNRVMVPGHKKAGASVLLLNWFVYDYNSREAPMSSRKMEKESVARTTRTMM